MTRQEAATLVTKLTGQFPSHGRSAEALKLYIDDLARFDQALGESAVLALIGSEEFFPSVANLRSAILAQRSLRLREASGSRESWVTCRTCKGSGAVQAKQRKPNGQLYPVSGRCDNPGCKAAERLTWMPMIDRNDPTLIWDEVRPEPVDSRVAAQQVREGIADLANRRPMPIRPRYEPPEPEMPVEESGQVDIWAPVEMTPEQEAAALRFVRGAQVPQSGGYGDD